jgi:hypothetical protein
MAKPFPTVVEKVGKRDPTGWEVNGCQFWQTSERVRGSAYHGVSVRFNPLNRFDFSIAGQRFPFIKPVNDTPSSFAPADGATPLSRVSGGVR